MRGISRRSGVKARSQRRGAIIVLTCFLIVVLVGIVAFTVDLGYITLTKTELQSAADSAALAGASELVNGTSAAQAEALSYITKNKAGGHALTSGNVTFEFGDWNPTSRKFTTNSTDPNGIRVTSKVSQQPTFFAKIFGMNSFDTSAEAIAVYQPRDISIVLDYSGSMCYDSQFRNINLIGQAAVEANLKQIYQELGSPTYGKLTFAPVAYGTTSTSATNVKSQFGLTNVAYPYPGGSWDEFINYVQSDSYVNSAGYRCKYGYLTWLNYVLAKRCGASDSPGLDQVSEQPVTALKDAVDVFLSYISAHCTDDRVSLSLYTYSDGTAKLEQALTTNYSSISKICRKRQAGHYTGGTNISAGMNKGRVDLQKNARVGALKLMLVMTDGVVNLPSGNTTNDKAAVITEANACAAAKIKCVTVCVGAYADTALMKQVADITGGAAFVVPGGQPIADVKQQLEAAFGQVAKDRPLKLVQ
jgi:Flp pilus assembly protein TadG